MSECDTGVFSFLGRFNNQKDDARITQWFDVLKKLLSARCVDEPITLDSRYLTLENLGTSSSLPKSTIYRRVYSLEDNGHVAILTQPEIGRFSEGAFDFLKNSPLEIDELLLRYLTIAGISEGGLVLRNNMYQSLAGFRYPYIMVQRRITLLTKKGLYERVHANGHAEVRSTVQGRGILQGFLEPLCNLANGQYQQVQRGVGSFLQKDGVFAAAVCNSASLYADENPNIH